MLTTKKWITILLVDDHMIVREGLRKLLESDADIEVVGEASTGRQAVDMACELSPAVIVMDIAMPQLNGLEATRQIRHHNPDAKVLILSAYSDDAYVEKVMELGAKGYLLKQTSAHLLVKAIQKIENGNTLYGPVIAKRCHHRCQEIVDRQGQFKEKRVVLLSPYVLNSA